MNNFKNNLTSLITVALLIGAMIYTGQVSAYYAGGNVSVNSRNIQWTVVNHTSSVMHCSGRIYGRANTGVRGSERVSVTVAPGRSATRYLYTYGSWYFVNGHANVNCQV